MGSRLLRHVAALMACAFQWSCGAGLGAGSGPETGWHAVTSEHFVVYTEFDRATASEVTLELEQSYAAFEQIAYPHQPKPDFLTEFVLLEEQKSLEELGYKAYGGVLRHRSGFDLEEQLTLITYGKLGGSEGLSSRARFQHELAHRFTAFHFPGAPIWVSEGLSELYSTLEIDGPRVLVGRHLRHRVFVDGDWALTWGTDTDFIGIPRQAVPPVSELIRYSASRFYGDEASPDPESDAAIKERVKNYSAAWNLAHLLVLGAPEYRARFRGFLQALATGTKSAEQAWDEHFSDLAPRVERDYQAQLRTTTRNVAWVPFSPPAEPKLRTRTLEPAEFRVLLASLRNSNLPEQRRLAQQDLRRAVELDPRFVAGRLARGLALAEDGDVESAAREIAAAKKLAGDSAQVLQAELVLARVQRDHASIRQTARRLARSAVTAAQYVLVAESFLSEGRRGAALRYAMKGIERDSTCWRCFWIVAEADAAQDKFSQAVVAQTTAVNLLSEDDPRRDRLMRRLDELVRAASAKKAAGDSTESEAR